MRDLYSLLDFAGDLAACDVNAAYASCIGADLATDIITDADLSPAALVPDLAADLVPDIQVAADIGG
jgi:hypothetical protein